MAVYRPSRQRRPTSGNRPGSTRCPAAGIHGGAWCRHAARAAEVPGRSAYRLGAGVHPADTPSAPGRLRRRGADSVDDLLSTVEGLAEQMVPGPEALLGLAHLATTWPQPGSTGTHATRRIAAPVESLSDAVVPISYSPDNGQHYYQLKVYKSPTSPNRLAQFRLAGPVHAGASADSPTVYC